VKCDKQCEAKTKNGDWHPELNVGNNGFKGAACGWRCAQTVLAAI